MFELLVGSDTARRGVQNSLEYSGPAAPKAERARSRRYGVRSITGLLERRAAPLRSRIAKRRTPVSRHAPDAGTRVRSG
jgi:hypothetical protein